MLKNKILKLYGLTIFGTISALFVFEMGIRYFNSRMDAQAPSVHTLIATLSEINISGREIGNQMIAHNVFLFKRHPAPHSVETAYVGTSRTKVIRPEYFGLPSSIVGAGNSYNEITYGLLLQAEILRLRFPNLKKVYFETSSILRRPGRLLVEEDHKKYLPLLNSISGLCGESLNGTPCRRIFQEAEMLENTGPGFSHSELMRRRGELRFASLIENEKQNIPLIDDSLFATLKPNGERNYLPKPVFAGDVQKPEVSNENVKVQRLRDIESNAPWDGLFDLIAIWGKKHEIEIVFFQPPVRSDLYRFESQYGMAQHLADIKRISKQYNIPFIDLNKPGLGYLENWSLFSDEDHMETCRGSAMLTLAVDDGYKTYRATADFFPEIKYKELRKKLSGLDDRIDQACGNLTSSSHLK